MNARAQPLPTVEQLLVARVGRNIRAARNHLLVAMMSLDDAGREDDEVSRAYSFTARISSAYSGRRRPPEHQPVPDHIAESAVAWRCQNGRSY
jgi:hypothetical protein